MMLPGPPKENGYYFLILRGGFKLAGQVRLAETNAGPRLEVQVPRTKSRDGYVVILPPDGVEQCAACAADEAELIAAALRQDLPLTLPSYNDTILPVTKPPT
jgi:hypothetical protein